MSYVIGLDFGTDSVRSVVVNVKNGQTEGNFVYWYPEWRDGKYSQPAINQFRQHPKDHIEGMEITIREAIRDANISPADIKAICIDTTGSSPVPVDKNGKALSLLPEFDSNPNAMVILWKDHTAIAEAEEINQLAKNWGGVDYTRFEGGIYSSEWFWAKILHIIRNDEKVKKAAYSWMEHCDLMTFILTGGELSSLKRSRCAAGHKAMWHESWGGLPSEDFLYLLDPYLADLRNSLYNATFTSDTPSGSLSAEWATRLGLSTDVKVAVGTFDAHAGAVGSEVKEYTLVRVMGTSTCDIIVAPQKVIGENPVKGICGQVDGSVIPGMVGLEAGQSAFGDVLAWFGDVLCWPTDQFPTGTSLSSGQIKEIQLAIRSNLLAELSKSAEATPINENIPLALDWVNGRRTPDADQSLKAALIGLNLGTKAPEIFRALVEAICYGSRSIVERFADEGVIIKKVVGIGGVAKKSDFIMQTLADVLNRPIHIAVSDQAPALGSAMYASVAAGIYGSVEDAINAMGNGFEKTYEPRLEVVSIYERLYAKYQRLGSFVENKLN